MGNQITIEEMKNLPQESYILIDFRDEYAFSYGHINIRDVIIMIKYVLLIHLKSVSVT